MSYEPDYAGGSTYEMARQKVSVPGIFLAVVGGLNLLAGGYGLFEGVMASRMSVDEFEKELFDSPLMSAEQKKQWAELKRRDPQIMEKFHRLAVNITFGVGAAAAVGGLVTLLGGIRMVKLRSYGLAVTGAILAAIPVLSPLACPCLLGMAVGIWALVVLFDARVKAAFGSRPAPLYGEDYRDSP